MKGDSMTNFQYFLPIIVGALIGYLTNWVAIKLLFWPKKPIGPIHGAIPKNKERLARDIGRVTVNHLLTTEQLAELVRENFSKETLYDMVGESSDELVSYLNQAENKGKIVEFVTTLLSKDGTPNPMVTMFLQGAVNSMNLEKAYLPYKEGITATISEKLYPVMEKKLPDMIKKSIPENLIEDKISQTVRNMDEDRIEKIVKDVTQRELILIKWSGAVLGAIIGMVQLMLILAR